MIERGAQGDNRRGARAGDRRPRSSRAGRAFGGTEHDVSEPLPLFPLGVVLFPGMLLPLHIFEER